MYASRNISVEDAQTWCKWRAVDIIDSPTGLDYQTVVRVESEMPFEETQDHLEHWSNFCGTLIWSFLVWEATIVNGATIERALGCARNALHAHPYLKDIYPNMDFTKDSVVEFLQSHIGCVVWGDNDGA